MDIYDSLFSPEGMLNEQIARQIFEILPERGPLMMIMDNEGNFWPSNSEQFTEMNISEPFLREVCARIDDGAEPVVTSGEDCSIIACHLTTERTNCGYVIIALAHYSPESVLINIDIIETLLNQVCLIAKLIEKNDLLYELQIKQFSEYGQSDAAFN